VTAAGPPPPELDVETVLRVLAEHEVAYLLVGGVAAVMHGAPVLTQDVDVLPEPGLPNLERLAAALRDLEAVPFDDPERVDLRTGHVPEAPDFAYTAAALRRHDTWHLATRAGLVDLVFSLSGPVGGFAALAERRVPVRVFGLLVPVASLDDVIASKRAAGRPKDLAALPVLQQTRRRLQRDG
jgi:hypothetical protein